MACEAVCRADWAAQVLTMLGGGQSWSSSSQVLVVCGAGFRADWVALKENGGREAQLVQLLTLNPKP